MMLTLSLMILLEYFSVWWGSYLSSWVHSRDSSKLERYKTPKQTNWNNTCNSRDCPCWNWRLFVNEWRKKQHQMGTMKLLVNNIQAVNRDLPDLDRTLLTSCLFEVFSGCSVWFGCTPWLGVLEFELWLLLLLESCGFVSVVHNWQHVYAIIATYTTTIKIPMQRNIHRDMFWSTCWFSM